MQGNKIIQDIAAFLGTPYSSEVYSMHRPYPGIIHHHVFGLIQKTIKERYIEESPKLNISNWRDGSCVNNAEFAKKDFFETDKSTEDLLDELYSKATLNEQGEEVTRERTYFLISKSSPLERLVIKTGLQGYEDPEAMVEIFYLKPQEMVASKLFYEFTLKLPETKLIVNNQGVVLDPKEIKTEELVLSEKIETVLKHEVLGLMQRRAIYERLKVPFKRGLLFYGPPGNGKTSIGKILATKMNANFLWVTPGRDHYAPVKQIKEYFAAARLVAPAVIFFEDIDLLIGEGRGAGENPGLGTLLNQLDGFESNHGIITIATTNKIEVLDKALSDRPGRFDVKIEFPNPDEHQRVKILANVLAALSSVEIALLHTVAKQLDNFSCAQVTEVARRACIHAVERDPDAKELTLQQEDFELSVKQVGMKKGMGFTATKTSEEDV